MNTEQPIQIVPQPTLDTASIMSEVNKEGEFVQAANRYEVEQDAIFINYDAQDLVLKLSTYFSLNIYERKAYAKHIGVIAKELLGAEPTVMREFLLSIAKDNEEIKNDFLHEVKILLDQGCPEVLQESIVDSMVKMLRADSLDLKERTADVLGYAAPKISEKIRTEVILKEAIRLVHDENEENKMVGVQLLTKLAGSLSKDYCEQFVAKEMLSLGDHQSIRVRKEAVLCLPLLACAVNQRFFQNNLLYFYQKKCQENTWSVRKVCVDVIVELVKQAKSVSVKQELSKWMLHFLKDGHKTVRINAHKALPTFLGIVQLPKTSPFLQRLIEPYLKLLDSELNQQVGSNEIVKNIAFTFPAVLHSLGGQKWKQLYPIFNRMMKFLDKDVRIPLACSLHEIGRIIGPELSKQHLFPCLDYILKDGCDQLKLGSISHLTEFVEIFNSEIRENLIDVFLVLQRDPRKWRIRQCIASQIGQLSRIYTSQVVFQYIVPIAFKLCSDPVSQVRQEACKNICSLVEVLKDQPSFLFVAIESMKGFAYSARFNQRQSFIDMVAHLFTYNQIFQKEIVPCLEALCNDKVAVVRVVLAQLIAKLPKESRDVPSIRTIEERLRHDANPDVLEALTQNE